MRLLLAPAMTVCLLSWSAVAGGPQAPPSVDFARDIQPVLTKSCIPCHGTALQGGGLRLDSRQGAYRGGMSGPAVIPGKGESSPLFRRISGLGSQPKMPLSGDKLAPELILRIRSWIDSGAVWPEDVTLGPAKAVTHWAWVPPRRPDVPAVRNRSWVRNPVDAFTLAAMEARELVPSPEAPREKLIRRATLDLTGLPPTPGEVEAFLADKSPDAYEKVVDRLLASPRYGERWARPWLDLARYADTHGYEKDMRRSVWVYRDWVINALNTDMSFDRFTIEQISGDLLQDATLDQKIATGFLRCSMLNEEGGIDPEEYRVAAVLDRVNTTASVWLGATLGCAQCHNHKFDPFSQEEYYRLFAYFNNTSEEIRVTPGGGRFALGPNLSVPAPKALAAHRRKVEEQIALLDGVLRTPTPGTRSQQAHWENDVLSSLPKWETPEPDSAVSVSGAALQPMPDDSFLATGKPPDRDTYVVSLRTPLRRIKAVRIEAVADASLPGAGVGRSASGSFSLTGVEVESAPSGQVLLLSPVEFSDAAAQSGSSPKAAIDDDPASAWSFTPSTTAEDTQIVLVAKAPFGFEGGTQLRIRLRHESATPQNTIGRFRISLTESADAVRSVRYPAAIQYLLGIPARERSPSQKQRLEEYYLSVAPMLEPMREWRNRLRSQWAELSQPATLVMKELPEPRKSYVHLGGNFLSRGKEVTPGVPAALGPLPKDATADRRGLARWLVDPQNPLTARVTMNRAWSQFFGRGIVETVEDFGTQGSPPTHPELLDWLATEFVARNWSLKAMHRVIVTSATYRQDSSVTPLIQERDPLNRWLARGPRPRLEAEVIRDSALAVAGLLSSRSGGPSVFPYQPEGIWNLVYNDDKWVMSDGEDRYRRSVYTFWRRTAPYPMFTTFDAPSREVTCTRRISTNTPLQSLMALNDPVFVDAARGLARRVLVEAPDNPDDRVVFLFSVSLARKPEPAELARVRELVAHETGQFRNDPAKAEAFVTGGDVRPPSGADNAVFAAWTVAANVILNLDEFLTRP